MHCTCLRCCNKARKAVRDACHVFFRWLITLFNSGTEVTDDTAELLESGTTSNDASQDHVEVVEEDATYLGTSHSSE